MKRPSAPQTCLLTLVALWTTWPCFGAGLYAHSRLLPTRGPHDPSWTNSMAICVAMRDENVTDVREWLNYYRWLGVDRVFLTENNSQRTLDAGLRDFIQSGFVTYRLEPRPFAMLTIYRETFFRERGNFNWIAFFDADEYLVIRDGTTTLKGLLNDYKDEVALSVHWVRFGWNRRLLRPAAGGVIRHYTACEAKPATTTKSIVNTYFATNTGGSPHTFSFRDHRQPVNDARLTPGPNRLDARPNKPPPPHIVPPSIQRAALFHYQVKSAEDFLVKIRRGGGDGLPKDETYFHRVNGMTTSQAPLCSELANIAHLCCPQLGPEHAAEAGQVQR